MTTNVFRVNRENSYEVYFEKNGRYYVTYWGIHKIGIYEPMGTHRISKGEYEQAKENGNGKV